MKIGCLQFAPRLGEVENNIAHANGILDGAPMSLGLLVLPELAFTGYNFASLDAIRPYLEPSSAGRTTQWAMETARRLRCHIIVGYPETCVEDGVERHYNATVTVSAGGEIVATYRKAFLYYTDETWASEGPRGNSREHVPNRAPFFHSRLPTLSAGLTIGHGICMDINPYRFEAPWEEYEFANCMLRHKVRLVVLSMAWLTRLMPQDLQADPHNPDMETVAYWLERFWPFTSGPPGEEIIVVFANRCGIEGNAVPAVDGPARDDAQLGAAQGDRVCYAGSSCVMKFQGGSPVRTYERSDGQVAIMGKNNEGLLIVDTSKPAKFRLQQTTQ